MQPKRRQALLNWGIAPGIDVEKETENKMKTNKYLEKVAKIEKRAWDSDYEYKNEYGVAANRGIGRDDVHTMLMEASKHSHLHVGVEGEGADGKWLSLSSEEPEKFKAGMESIRAKLGPRKSVEQLNKEKIMDWDRGLSWSIGMDKNHPLVQKSIGKKNKYGEVMDAHGAVLHHIFKHVY